MPKTPPTHTRPASLEALLTGLIDYAGLFPPAALDMATTVKHYARYLGGPEAWMLGRLIVPAGKLDEFEAVASGLLPDSVGGEPWRLSGLVAAAGDPGLAEGLNRIERFNRDHADAAAGLAAFGGVELRAETSEAVEIALDAIPDALFAFFEVPIDADPRGLVAAIAGNDAGAKVRTGGLRPEAYPAPEHLARFIAACAAADVPFKATAGLHHPVRHHNESVGTDEFGFLNVFTAGVIAATGTRDPATLVDVLVEADPQAFEFGADAMTWRGLRIPIEQIDEARQRFAISVGSCSFEEPLDELRRLNLL